MKLCVDCKYYEEGAAPNGELDLCLHPQGTVTDDLHGIRMEYTRQKVCVGMRNWSLTCGPEAKLFEPKEPA